MNKEQKCRSILLAVGYGLIFVPPLITVAILKWAETKVSVGSILGTLSVLLIIGFILILVGFIQYTIEGISNFRSKFKYAATEILVIVVVPVLIYWAINPYINNSIVDKPGFIDNLLIVSTVLLGFTMAVGGIRGRIPEGKLLDALDNKALIFAKSCLIASLIIGFNTIVWILRWMVVNNDQLLNWIIAFFALQISFTFLSSFTYLYFRIFYVERVKN